MKPLRRALVVDDHPENAYLLCALLGANDYAVTTAANGVEALEQAHGARPDLIVSDILMPVMDGFSLCRECKRDPELAQVPFVFYTATYTDPRDEELALSLGADLFLVKPTEPEALLESLARVVRRERPALRPDVPPAEPPSQEGGFLKQYNEALVRKLEAKLQQLEQANRSLALRSAVIEASVSGVVLAGPDGRISYVNPSFARIWGVPVAALPGQPLLELISDASARATVEEDLAAQGCWAGEVRTRRPDGTSIVLQGLFERVAGPAGEALCLMLSCTDGTERSRMREELQRTQRLESLSVFSRSIAHDFNNLLMGLLGNVELAVRALPPGSPALKYLDVALGVHERARSLTERLQGFARGGPARRQPSDLRELLGECAALSLSGSNVRFELSAAQDLRCVDADPNQLAQLFNNLLINARQAMDRGGCVFVSAVNLTTVEDRPGGLRPGEYVEVAVRDEGPGIPEEVAARVFDPFFTTKPGGTGLGLATSYWIVKEHGGEIRVAQRDHGAELVVRLPASGHGPCAPAGPAAADLVGRGRVLVMDDERIVRQTVRRMLTLAGYDVVTAADAEQAVAAFAAAAAQGHPIDLSLLDVTVRGGAGGLDTLVRLRAVDPEAVVVLSSGYHDEPTIARATALGCAAFLQKPYRQHELLSLVKAVGRRH